MSEDFKDKVVLVTGAGSGIGREAARLYATRGARVFGADLNEAGLAETEALIRSAGQAIDTRKTDVSREADVKALVDHVERNAGRLDIAFNNAGITGGTHRIEDYPVEDFDKVVAVNLRSVFLGMKHKIPAMLRAGGGTIVNTASVAALTGPGGMSAYAASKHGVTASRGSPPWRMRPAVSGSTRWRPAGPKRRWSLPTAPRTRPSQSWRGRRSRPSAAGDRRNSRKPRFGSAPTPQATSSVRCWWSMAA